TTTTVSGPFVGSPASRTAAPAVVPAGTRTRVDGLSGAEVVTTALSLASSGAGGFPRGITGGVCAPARPCYRHPRARVSMDRRSRANPAGRRLCGAEREEGRPGDRGPNAVATAVD